MAKDGKPGGTSGSDPEQLERRPAGDEEEGVGAKQIVG